MIPGGMNPKQMQQIMKKMGIKVEEIEAERVVIECADRKIIISEPQVMLTKMPGQEMFQISGEVSEAEAGEEDEVDTRITDDDIDMVADKAGVGRERAEEMLEETRGDIAEAIMRLKEGNIDSDAADKD